MPKYVAFLRAINVGGHTVKMDQLRRLFEAMKFSNVQTLIASGNVIFDSPSKSPKILEGKIEQYLQKALGYRVATFIRSTAEVADIARYKPFSNSELNAESHVLYIGFLATTPTREAIKKLGQLTTNVDDFHVKDREVYWLRRREIGESLFSGALLEKTLGMQATLRNCTTIRKIAEKYA
jgi:uncharacterized protein (DUF1697 family)